MCSASSAQNKTLLTSPLRSSVLISVVSLTGLMLGQAPTSLAQAQTGWSVRDLHPGEYEISNSNGVSESIQGGTAHFLIDLESGPMGPWIEPRAGYWRGTSRTFVEINPPGSLYSAVNAVWGELLVGYFADSRWLAHAGVWMIPAAAVIDLHPTGYAFSKIFATNGRQHAGYARKFPAEAYEVAMLWTGTSTEAVELAIPADAKGALATAISTNQQGGFVYFPYEQAGDVFRHAFLWNGDGGRVVDLHPIGAFASEIRAMTDTYQAGTVTLPSAQNASHEALLFRHAALWFGSPESFRVIGPPGSYIQAASGPYQVGTSNGHATLWSSSESSAFDLHTLLPSGYNWSAANSIWTDGNKIVIGGCADSHAVLWTYTPPGAPTFTALPQSITIAAGSSFVLSASATASSAVSFQWQCDAADIAGATSPMLLGSQPTPGVHRCVSGGVCHHGRIQQGRDAFGDITTRLLHHAVFRGGKHNWYGAHRDI